MNDDEGAEDVAPESTTAHSSDSGDHAEDVAGRRRITVADLRRAAAEDPEAASRLAETGRRLAGMLEGSDAVKEMVERMSPKIPVFETPALDALRRHQEDSQRVSAMLDEAMQEKWEREQALGDATLEMAEAQQHLRDLQEQSVQLMARQADATAAVAVAQQEVLKAVRDELVVLKQQHEALKEQVDGQRRLIHSGWAGGVVMEWTLLVAVIAAVATIAFALRPAKEMSSIEWVAAAVAFGSAAVALAIWQRRRRPSPRIQAGG